ncbi:MAG: hypothetical protein ABI609_13610 [Acidobacteriota bacterium]
MRQRRSWLWLSLGVVAVFCGGGAAWSAQGSGGAFSAPFAAGGTLRLHVRSGEVQILGSDRDEVAVHYEGKNAFRSGEVSVSMERPGELTVQGGPENDLRIVIEIPQRTNLVVRMPWGDLGIAGVTGDKDVRLHGGDLRVDLGEPTQYASTEASVLSGELIDERLGIDKGGLFRSFESHGPGSFHVYLHVGAGQLTIKN